MKEEGDIAEMSCTDMAAVQKYYPDARMEWTKNGKEFQLDGLRVRIDRKTLVFEEVHGEDSGVYLCQVDYGGREELTVGVFSLAVSTPHAQVFVHQGQDFNLTCNGEQLGLLFNACTQKWFKDERAVKSYGDIPPQEANVEIFRRVDDRFAGSYSCVVYHPQTDRQWTTNIVNVTVLPPLGLVDVIWGKAQTNMKLVGGVGSGVTILLVILCTMIVITCRSGKDKKS
ncbi:cell adhesion molecule Dscam2-like [Amphiura filiformis]|uniref:cell adhesion molecule Dscam2-like n=1 Tax=Amphiura filiformis TaxID=82378 RepID=UPI003B226DF0